MELTRLQMGGVFVSSFSKGVGGDSLAMWRAYSSSSGGYSIGFDPSQLRSLAASVFPSRDHGIADLRKCRYIGSEDRRERAKFSADIQAILPEFFNSRDALSELKRNGPRGNTDITIGQISDFIDRSTLKSAAMKNRGFLHESEWRIILIDKSMWFKERALFRQGKSLLVPYVEVDWRKEDCPNPIKRIVVGPTPLYREGVQAVRMLLESKGIGAELWEDSPNQVEVVPSEIPYRNW